MSWTEDFMSVAAVAMQREDLRQRLIYAESASSLPDTPGVARAYETSVVLAIYEAGYRLRQNGAVLAHEHPYPRVAGAAAANRKRADLAFKEAGRGRNWCFIEVKYYSPHAVRSDIRKLQGIRKRAQRWLLIYRVRTGNMWPLKDLLSNRFSDLAVVSTQDFPSVFSVSVPGTCDIALARVAR